MILGPVTSPSLGNLPETKILGQPQTYQIGKSGDGSPAVCSEKRSTCSDASLGLRTTALNYLPGLTVCGFPQVYKESIFHTFELFPNTTFTVYESFMGLSGSGPKSTCKPGPPLWPPNFIFTTTAGYLPWPVFMSVVSLNLLTTLYDR